MDTILKIVQNITDHWGLSSGAAILIARLIYWEITTRLPKLITQKEEQLISEAISKLSAPEDIALFKSIVAWMDAKIPNAGDTKYNVAAIYIVAQYKALLPYKDHIAALLSELGQAAKDGVESPPQQENKK